jgi:4-methyl-5(b-hydroxyethyl)-thiazole monophosphate biosynthesis
MKKVFLFLADGFEEIEAIAPIDILRRAEINITTVSVMQTKEVTGAHNVTITADRLFEEADFSGNDMLILPGGMPGTTNLDNHAGLKTLIKKQIREKRKISAICAAPSILGKMGLLEGKEAIAYPGFESQLKGAVISQKTVAKAGNIITAKGPGIAIDFALAIIEDLKGKQVADDVACGLIY